MRSTLTRGIAAAVALIVPLFLGAGTAHAAYRSQDSLRLAAGGSFEKSYPPITGMFPDAGFGQVSPEFCEDSTACDLIEIKLAPADPTGFGYETVIRVSWPDELEQNDVDVYLYDEAGNEVIHAATAHNPESFGATYEGPIIVEEGMHDIEAGTYYLAVLNFSGVNQGYTVEGSMVKNDIALWEYDAEGPRVAGGEASSTSKPVVTPSDPVEVPRSEPAGPAPESITYPGADGPDQEVALPSIPARLQSALFGGTSFSSLLGTILMIVTILGGTVIVGTKIRREIP